MYRDVFVNVAGGLKIRETAADLPVAMALLSALVGWPVDADVAMFGEVGLAGEIRAVDRAAARLREVKAMGFERCLVAKGNVTRADVPKGLEIEPVDSVKAAVTLLFGDRIARMDAAPKPRGNRPASRPSRPGSFGMPPSFEGWTDANDHPPDGWGPRPID